MLPFLSNILLVNPLILTALAALPLLWFLLRVTPPAARQIEFYGARFLEGLIPENVTPSKTPWWLLLLRLLVAALVIFALSQPVYNPAQSLSGSGPLRLVINNDWASAQNWPLMTKSAEHYLAQAERENRPVHLIITAKAIPQENAARIRIMSAAEALNVVKALTPKPWSNDYSTLTTLLENTPQGNNFNTIFLSSGIAEDGLQEFTSALRRSGNVLFIKMEPEKLPVALHHPESISMALQTGIVTPSTLPAGIPFSAQARTSDGRLLGSVNLQSKSGVSRYDVAFEVPELLRNEVGQFSIAGRPGAATTYLLDERFRKRAIGIAAEDIKSDTPAALSLSVTYIRKALEPYAALHFGTINDLLKQDISMMILPDIGAIPTETLNNLEKWVTDGGLLLRFAGPNMTQNINAHYLVPVPLRAAGRSLDGALSWETPLPLNPFPASSPFYGMEIPADITINQQVLAEPVQNIEELTWASLKDGTPIITADRKGEGLLVLVHTTASPDWSNFALSGLYVKILRRLGDLSGKSTAQVFNNNTVLDPLYILDGFGTLKQPDSSVKPLTVQDDVITDIGPEHPPGVYGRGGVQKIVNLGDSIETIQSVGALPLNISVSGYERDYELDLRPYLLYAALALLLLDWLIMIFMSLGLRHLDLRRATLPILLLALLPSQANAQERAPSLLSSSRITAENLKYADDLYLAYIKTGDSTLDATTQSGLEVLAAVLTMRTSAEPAGVVGLAPDSEILPFFPMIYWPISPNATTLSAEALENVQHYLDHGGTILFDTREQSFTTSRLGGTPNGDSLKNLLANLNIPPLQPIPDDHVLGRSFYLLKDYPGRISGGILWVEVHNADNIRDGVSSVLIGSHDWAASWADNTQGRNRNLYGANKQQEHALRFGVNLMMYALTGNYKADQVHVPHILERLGE